jgi:hypothetical protein
VSDEPQNSIALSCAAQLDPDIFKDLEEWEKSRLLFQAAAVIRSQALVIKKLAQFQQSQTQSAST